MDVVVAAALQSLKCIKVYDTENDWKVFNNIPTRALVSIQMDNHRYQLEQRPIFAALRHRKAR